LIQSATNFFAKLIKINPLIINKYNDTEEHCQDNKIKVPTHVKDSGIPNSDLHIFFCTMDSSYILAQTAFCYKEKSESKKRSTFGMI